MPFANRNKNVLCSNSVEILRFRFYILRAFERMMNRVDRGRGAKCVIAACTDKIKSWVSTEDIDRKPVRKLITPLQIKRILAAQWLVTLCMAVVLFMVKPELALSALSGGLICTLPNMYFARQLFTRRRIAEPYGLLRSVYVAEFIKIALAGILFAIILISYKEIHLLTLFITYFFVQSCMWFVPLIMSVPNNRITEPTF